MLAQGQHSPTKAHARPTLWPDTGDMPTPPPFCHSTTARATTSQTIGSTSQGTSAGHTFVAAKEEIVSSSQVLTGWIEQHWTAQPVKPLLSRTHTHTHTSCIVSLAGTPAHPTCGAGGPVEEGMPSMCTGSSRVCSAATPAQAGKSVAEAHSPSTHPCSHTHARSGARPGSTTKTRPPSRAFTCCHQIC